MYAELIPFLRCPSCAAHPLTLLGLLTTNDEIVAGALRCAECGGQTAIIDGVWNALNNAPLPLTPAQLTNYLSLTAHAYEPLWRRQALSLLAGRRFPLREELRLLHDLIQPQTGQLYVDVACSAGLYARALAHPGTIVAGIDHSWAFVHHARTLARRNGLRISYIRAAAQGLPFADGVAAGAAMGGSLNELGDQATALREIRRILDAEGRFFCMNLIAATSVWGRIVQRVLGTGGIVFPTPDELNAWFQRAGLERRAQWFSRVVAITLLEPAAPIA